MDFKDYNMKEFEDLKCAEHILLQRCGHSYPRGSKKITPSVNFKWSRLRAYVRLRIMFKRRWFEMN